MSKRAQAYHAESVANRLLMDEARHAIANGEGATIEIQPEVAQRIRQEAR